MQYPTINELLEAIAELTEEEKRELKRFIDFIRSLRDEPSARRCRPKPPAALPGSNS